MSSPFGSPFGTQQNILGGPTNQQSAFGVTPAFGQQSVFGQTTTALGFPTPTLSTPASFFGQNQVEPTADVQAASTPQSNLFSSQSTSTISQFTPASTASSVFVQGSSFGQTSAQAGSSLFNKPASSSTQGVQNVFGVAGSANATSTALGTNAPSLFGVPGHSVAFQSTSVFTSSTFGQTTAPQSTAMFTPSTFGPASTPQSTSMFTPSTYGQTAPPQSTAMFTPSTYGQTAPPQSNFPAPTPGLVFGGTGHIKKESSSNSISSADLFGKHSGATAGNVATALNAFGHLPEATGSNLATTNLFGKPVATFSQTTQPVFVKDEDTKPALFGVGGQSAASAWNQDTKPAGLFGKVKQEATESVESKPDSSAIFGGTRIKQADMFGGKAGSDSAQGTQLLENERPGTSGNQKTGLFGKGKPDDRGILGRFGKGKPDDNIGVQGARLFGKGKQDSSGAQGAGLFGKGKTLSKTLFGKPVKTEDNTKAAAYQENEIENPIGGQHRASGRQAAATGLFGKSSRRDDRADNSGLFGKHRISRSRMTSSPDDKEDSRPSLRRQASDEISSKVAIVCRNVPAKYNTAFFLRRHFKRYGEVTKVFPNQAKMQATIHFRTHESAADAKRRGRLLDRGVTPMTIFWSNYSATARSTKNSTEIEVKSSRPLKRTSDTDLMPRSKKPSWSGNDPVNEELNSMSGTDDFKDRMKEGQRSSEQRSWNTSPTPSASSMDIKHSAIVTLNMFHGVVARTTADREYLLKLRDKYIRQNCVKEKDMVKAFVGTCPDMCPERERYDRENKRQLNYYEIVPGTENIPGRNPQIDHRLAVKEYMRSSPDQDEPLPHHLRPLPVLLSTMTYLLREIANRGEDGRWGDWFDFLWNRTRGIRKDIIQQQLSDDRAVDLIEKCARFHIYCSERLCEEDVHSFDQKINNENLTKCLQTLREFYSDHEKKYNNSCKNEAEFRAYTVLMNLNEGDILREVQQLRAEIRTSPDIKFALQAYFAVNANNYIRFFRLVKQASFTNACIMHRYFTQVRNRALTLMMKGYSMGNRSAQVPVNELVRLLAFESVDEATAFCEHYGFNISDGEAMLDRAEYIEPDTVWAPVRCESLIESKLMISAGELINGGPFPDTEHLLPTSSFNQDSRFYSSIDLPSEGVSQPSTIGQHAGVQVKQEPVDVKQETSSGHRAEVKQEPVEVKQESSSIIQEVDEKPSLKKIPVEFIKDSAKILFWEVIDEVCHSIGQEVKLEVDAMLHYSEDYLHSLLGTTLQEEVRQFYDDAYQEDQLIKHKALQLELEQRRERVTELLTDDLMYDLIYQESRNLATIEMREVKAQLKRECIERVTVEINSELVEEVMNEMVADVSEDVFETDVRQRLKQLDDLERLVKMSRLGRFLHKWKKEYKAVSKLKRAMQEFPCAPNLQSTKEQLKLLIISDDDKIVDKKFFVNKRAKLTIETPLEIEKHRREADTCVLVHSLYRDLLYRTSWSPLDLGRLVGKQLTRHLMRSRQQKSQGETLYWKLLLCLPDIAVGNKSSQSGVITEKLCEWLKAKFSKGSPPASEHDFKGEVISLYRCRLPERPKPSRSVPVSLGICVRTVDGYLDDDDVSTIEENSLFLGSSALLFVLPAGAPLDQSKYLNSRQYWKDQYSRLKGILQVRPMCQGFPLVVVIPVPANASVSLTQIVQCLSLAELLDEKLLGDVDFVQYDLDESRPDGINLIDPKISEQLCEGVQWLAERSRPLPDLTVHYYKDVLDITLQEHYYTPVQHNQKKRKQLVRLDQNPNNLLELYNTVISHLSDVLISDTLHTISWPVTEFASNHTSALPPTHWNRADDHLAYLSLLIESLRLPAYEFAHADSEDWRDVKQDLWSFVSSFTGSDYGGARIKLFSRLNHLLRTVEVDFEEACSFQYGEPHCEPTFYNVPWSTVVSLCIDYKLDTLDLVDPHSQDEEELRIAYIQEEMKRYVPPFSWKYIEADETILETPCLEDTIQRAVYRVKELRNKHAVKTEIDITEDPLNISVVATETKNTSSTLIKSLKSERRNSDHFQKYLENALKDGDSSPDTTLTGSASFSVFETENQSFDESDFSAISSERRISFDPSSNQRRLSFDATAFFNRSQNDISAIFDPQEGKSLVPPSRRKSDIGLHELSLLPGKKRRQRLSEIYNNDPVMMYLREPAMNEDIENFRENLLASRRESDLFEKKLRLILQDQTEPF